MIRNEKGSTMVMLILILAILSLFGIVLMNTSLNENRNANKEHEYQQAYFIARAGAEAAADFFNRNALSDSVLSSYQLSKEEDLLNNASTDFNGVGSFKVGVMPQKDTTDFIIKSIGTTNDGLSKTVVALLEQEPPFGGDAAIVVNNNITFLNGKITGKIKIDHDGTDNIDYDENKTGYDPNDVSRRDVDYDVYAPSTSPIYYDLLIDGGFNVSAGEKKFDGVKEDIYNANVDLYLDCSEDTGSFQDYVGKYMGNLDLGQNNLTIYINNDGGETDPVPELYFKNLIAGKNVDITGTGKLIIRVQSAAIKCEFTTDNTMLLLTTYLDPDPDRNRPSFEYDIDISTGNSGAKNLFIFAPDKKVSLESNTKLYGAIISDVFYFNQGTTEMNYEVPPFTITGEEIGNEKYYDMSVKRC